MGHAKWAYGGLAAGLLGLEGLIARFAHDHFIRPYAGDFLITIFLYCLGRALTRWPAGRVLVGALLLSYLVELTQYAHLLAALGWQHVRVARLVLGSAFSWADMLAYTLGALLVLATGPRRSVQF
ncbi:hypothetical protein GCM10023172_16500 [Hymenobacter ginsengisoli]|uniref:DUF2809 domain-containing protein n=1 Tax=Hymenobacter ginsengisoli TaxID=1051626 RepID=A0ABP8QAJ5_9BACT|nr:MULTISPECIES: DUF2809 domain-containing protein [unclassified Hymenobacter]MBO2030805.1 DUF2809 domain-containing protein [Hymenobacter sp. BT559]